MTVTNNKTSTSGKPCLFFDRDGVINEPPPIEMRYLRDWKSFKFVPGMVEVLKCAREL